MEEKIAGGWFARGRMVRQGDRIVIAELRVCGIGETPQGGVTQDVVRSIPLGSFGPHVFACKEFSETSGIGGLRDWFKTQADAASPGMLDVPAPRPRPARKSGRGDLFYARLAANYVKAAARSRSPVKDLATARGETPARVRDMVHEARVRGLLSLGTAGARGGELLPRARMLLGKKGEKGGRS